MHILFLSDNFPPEVNAPASRTFEHCREWVRAGHRVTVITCAPNFPRGKVYPGYRNRLWAREAMAGVEVIRVWSYITGNEGFVRRSLDFMSFMVSGFVAALFVRRVDVIVGTSPQFFTACAACAVGWVRRRPFVFELRDIWPESIRAVGAMQPGRLFRALEALELFLYRRATAIVAVTHAFKANLVARGIDGGKIAVVTNGADLARFAPQPKDAELVASLGLQGKFVAGYVGTHGMAHALDTLLDAAALLKQVGHGAEFRLLMLGDGARRATLQARASADGLDNVLFLDSVPKDQVPRYWSLLDAAIIHLARNDLFTTVIPSKLFECMAMGIPVLHGVAGESAEIVTAETVGLTFTPEDAGELVDGLLRLRDTAGLRERFAGNGPRAALRYDRRALAADMLAVLERCAAPHWRAADAPDSAAR